MMRVLTMETPAASSLAMYVQCKHAWETMSIRRRRQPDTKYSCLTEVVVYTILSVMPPYGPLGWFIGELELG